MPGFAIGRRSCTSTLGAIVAAAALMLVAIPLSAHHGWGGYSEDEFEIAGTVVTPVSLAGPHATMKIRSGAQVWDVVLAPPARTERAGLTEGIIPLGATVKAHGHRHLDPKKFEIKTERLTWGERTFNVYPDRT